MGHVYNLHNIRNTSEVQLPLIVPNSILRSVMNTFLYFFSCEKLKLLVKLYGIFMSTHNNFVKFQTEELLKETISKKSLAYISQCNPTFL